MTTPPNFRLKVRAVEQICIFELTCDNGIELETQVSYPQKVIVAYQRWRNAYLSFYQSMRAQVKASGGIKVDKSHHSIDLRKQLAQTEAELLSEFHEWLSDGKLLKIRETLSEAVLLLNSAKGSLSSYVDVFLTCYSEELERLPWEAWEIGGQLTSKKMIRLARTPTKMKADTRQNNPRRKTRVLVILGDDTGLDFSREKQAIQSLGWQKFNVTFVGWQGKTSENLKEEVCQAIADKQGWDLLIFMGHSNETKLTGGELAIAPNTGILITELVPFLKEAKRRGLKFALFNSCEGLSIANTLIDTVGLGQVAIMREPIHNQVAEEFLIRFFEEIKNGKDVHEAILMTCEQLKKTCHITYPSGYLVPSLFRHPNTPLCQIPVLDYRPNRRELVTLLIFLLLSLLPTENLLLYPRLWVQAFYRDMTQQIPQTFPPVKLVTIDEETIQRQKIAATKVNPIDRILLAKLLDKLLNYQPKVIGIDYILDRSSAEPQEDLALKKIVRKAVKQKTWVVFAAVQNPMTGRESNVVVAKPELSLKGYVDFTDSVVEQLPADQFCKFACPFSYILALSSELQQESTIPLLSSDFSSQPERYFRDKVVNIAEKTVKNQRASPTIIFIKKYQNKSSLWQQFGQFKPIIDFSIPPEQVYNSIPAWKLLDEQYQASHQLLNSAFQQQIPILAPGGYEEAGVTFGEDTFPIPLPMSYWRKDIHLAIGAEFHAYMIHHWLNRHFVWLIPSGWLVILAALLGKTTTLYFNEQYQFRQILLLTAGYGILSLQLFVSANILLPWLLPSTIYWFYVLPSIQEK